MRREGFAHDRASAGEVCYPLSTVYAQRLAAPFRITRILRMHPSVCARTISCSRSKRLDLAWCRPERPTLDQRLRRPLLLGRLQQLDGKAENGGGRPSAALATRHGGFENIYVPSGENRLPCTLPQAHHRSTTTTRTHPVLRTSALDALTHVSSAIGCRKRQLFEHAASEREDSARRKSPRLATPEAVATQLESKRQEKREKLAQEQREKSAQVLRCAETDVHPTGLRAAGATARTTNTHRRPDV